jgi:hypothetical protein
MHALIRLSLCVPQRHTGQLHPLPLQPTCRNFCSTLTAAGTRLFCTYQRLLALKVVLHWYSVQMRMGAGARGGPLLVPCRSSSGAGLTASAVVEKSQLHCRSVHQLASRAVH